MSDAEAADGRLEAMPDRKRERQPSANAENEQRACDPADAGENNTALASANVSGEAAEDAERQADGSEQGDQDEVVAGGRKGVQVRRPDEEHEHERNDHAPAVQLPLPGLTEHEEDESCVEEILSGSHAAIIRGRPLDVVGSRVETPVDLHLNPGAELAVAGSALYALGSGTLGKHLRRFEP
jgi:hypothetical protein